MTFHAMTFHAMTFHRKARTQAPAIGLAGAGLAGAGLACAGLCALLLTACGGSGVGEGGAGDRAGGGTVLGAATVQDVHSFGRPEDVRVTHADLDWTIDFDAKRIGGSVTWTIERAPGAEEEPLILDTNGLEIESVTTPDGAPLTFDFAHGHPALGQALGIEIPAGEDRIVIRYRTKPDAGALQWLTPEQTAGKRKPYLFSQAQSILARTMLPCQDSPAVRITYRARVRTPQGLTAVMAAKRMPLLNAAGARNGDTGQPGSAATGLFEFEMLQPIPSYLIAIAVGEIDFREIGPRSGVFAEPSVVERAAWEFADTEAMIDATEKLYGPYRWERYDILVLPPSFPFGGMENPRLTFATPTWSDFWLNEGFTVYLERRILEVVYGKRVADMGAVLGRQDLLEDMKQAEPGFTALHNVSLEGRDPDDAFNDVPYEKGYLFLQLLENEVGRERLDAFLNRWFEDNAFQSRTTMEFEAAVREELFEGDAARPDALKVKEWFYEEGLPDNAPEARSDAFVRAEAAAKAFVAGEKAAAALPAKDWVTQEWQHFLRALPDDLDTGRMTELDAAWSLTQTGNSEILFEWLRISIRAGYEPASPALERFLTEQGRRKFLKPLYAALAGTENGRARALDIYRRARALYHPVSTNTIDKILDYTAG
jgi:aminopeptidase N